MDKANVEHAETLSNPKLLSKDPAPGDVALLKGSETILIPTPSADPKDPLNLPPWRKWMLLILVSAYSCTAVVLCSGMGPIFSVIQAQYPGEEERANDLLTYPTLFMGIGNLISMPFALTIGRRPVFLASMLLLIATGIWCACSQSLASHIAGRNIMSLAAGQSEALSPAIVQEIHFLHERGRKLAWFIFIQNVTAGVFFVTSTYMVSAWGWRWWYGFFTIMNAVAFVFSVVFASESLYQRSEEAMRGETSSEDSGSKHVVVEETSLVLSAYGTPLDIEQYGPRTWRHDLKLVTVTPNWSDIPIFFKHVAQGLCIPVTLWLLLLNGAFLGVYVFQSATFANVLLAPPWSWAFTSLGYVQAGQIACCIIFLPLLGYGSDITIRYFTKRNNGIYKPEYRLPMIGIPAAVGVICGIIYGQAASHPENWNVSAIFVSYNASFFAFLGANIVGITYAVDSFPMRAAPFLVVICAGRGIISFGLSYATLPAVQDIGYDMTMVVEMVICGVLALLAVPMFFYGPAIRKWFKAWVGAE
ncbi:major facilitator superfamily domain-containing protein [Aspergillus pseudodeflectus]|uniref:Major facilitator superfamily domain-containing protein n=1 Tax=Aspergillus pseudodeflectus TaxID=176178 RepID=A0ABR4KIN4_9EURO